jgi:hypothetical protein
MEELTKFLDTSLTIQIDKRLLIHLQDDFELMADYYVENLQKLASPSFKIDFIELVNPEIMSEIDAYNLYKYIITNERGLNMLTDIIKRKYNMFVHKFIVNNIIHHYIQDILDR